MEITITSFKSSGKWYEEFDTDIPEEIPCHDIVQIEAYLENKFKSLKEFNYTYKIDEPENKKWQWRLVAH